MTEPSNAGPGEGRSPNSESSPQEPAATAQTTSVWDRLKSNQAIRWTLFYAAAAATSLQVVDIVANAYERPGLTKWWLVLLLLGLLAVPVIAWYHGHRARKHVSAMELTILTVLLVVGFGLLWPLSGARIWNEPAGSIKEDKIAVLAVMSGGAPYEQIIVEALRKHLQAGLEAEGHRLEWKVALKGSDKSPESADGKRDWDVWTSNIVQLYGRSGLNYIVSVGSFASMALNDQKLAARIGAKGGHIFLGVTNPVGVRLVKSLNRDRDDEENIAGVRYGAGGQAFGNCVALLFPETQRLVFVRESASPQDEYMANEFAKLQAKTQVNIEDSPYSGRLEFSHLSDPSAVYFAWYGFDNVLADIGNDGVTKIFREAKVVPSTYTEENLNNAGVVVSVDDEAVGEEGAKLMLRAILDGENLRALPVSDVPFLYWIDLETVRTKGITLAPEIYGQTLDGPQDCAKLRR